MIFKTTNLAPKKVANVSSTVILLVLVLICAALLLVFGTIANGKYFFVLIQVLNCKLLLSQDMCNPGSQVPSKHCVEHNDYCSLFGNYLYCDLLGFHSLQIL